MPSLIGQDAIVLFQGDSITDAGRDRENHWDLGHGYAMMAASWFSALYPERRVTFLNRGVGGNRVSDLKSRWQRDCIDLGPTWVSIMVGINDTWRRHDSNDAASADQFEADYRDILCEAKERLGAQLILCEPFLLATPAGRTEWREDLEPKLHVVRGQAEEFGAQLVPLDRIFAEACERREPSFWAGDGVHPSLPGHALIAQAWLRTIGAL